MDVKGDEGLRARKKRELRERILASAARLFVSQGFAETKVEEIADELDVSAATVFNYFGSKDAILVEIAEGLIERFERVLDQFAQANEGGISCLEELPRAVSEAFRDGPQINRRIYADMLRVMLPHETGGRLARRSHAMLQKLCETGQTQGELRTDLPAELIADLVGDMLTGAFNTWLNDPRHPLGDRLARDVAFLQDALRPPS